ncbi:MurR/RpiR family transcriptional regulator [Bowmanella yangjiangensis]|uniref:MurR/RpiR family transcriptional regulator n=1 Tax=Bowmanella yangjiangensis TaxID=2811230 RepID=A0ABS3CTI1_9ALTE|nr:MurR/RpiR family transcriptional regulator [Bowmanella yangjiangensis]MBN7820416.1 MurR/RpiR family transcriptional regulator [Bowmanella yangjiangensis]
MTCLLKMQAMRENMSSSEKRLADFILDNTHLLRDYSSQQLANAVGVSQSSVVKFSQKMGYRGYPDLKLAVNESLARGLGLQNQNGSFDSNDERELISDLIRQEAMKTIDYLAEVEISDAFSQALAVLINATCIQVQGTGEGHYPATRLAQGLCQLPKQVQHVSDQRLDLLLAEQAVDNKVLVVISIDDSDSHLQELIRINRSHRAKIIGICKYGDTRLPSLCDITLQMLVDSHHPDVVVPPQAINLSYLVDLLVLSLQKGVGKG